MTSSDHRNVVRKLPLKVADFMLLDAAGAFAGYGKTELIAGEVVYMNAQHRPHARYKAAMYDALRDALQSLGGALQVLIEATVAIPPHDAPEPDLVVSSEPDGEGPVPIASVALTVEIADTTVTNDLGIKASTYAKGGVPEYWVADLSAKRVLQMWQPRDGAYGQRRETPFGDQIESATITGLAIRVP